MQKLNCEGCGVPLSDCGPIGYACLNKNCTYEREQAMKWLHAQREREERAELARLKELYDTPLKKMFRNKEALLDSLAVLRVEESLLLCEEIIASYHAQTEPLDELDEEDLKLAISDAEACRRVIALMRPVE